MSITQLTVTTQAFGGWLVGSILQWQQKLKKLDSFLMSGQWEWSGVGIGLQ